MTHALVPSQLDYCNALSVGLPFEGAQKLQCVQNTLTGAGHKDHRTPQLAANPFPGTIQSLVLTYKALHDLRPKVA